jgi:hypothetical protein
MPPGPSDPASIPTTRKRISVGIPYLKEVLLATMLIKSRSDPRRRIFSADKVMTNYGLQVHC